MQQHATSPSESTVLAVLAGAPVEEAARTADMSPAQLREAVEQYRAAGRAALNARLHEWHQVHIQFTDYPASACAFQAHLTPSLSTGPVGAWWFVRKYPCWRLRVRPSSGTGMAEAIAHLTEALADAVSRKVVNGWQTSLYEPETIVFGGRAGMSIAHDLFHTDSVGVLDYLHRAGGGIEEELDAKATSLLVVALMLRAAGLEWGEQGDVWGQVEARRRLPADVAPHQVSGMVKPLRQLLMTDVGPLLSGGPLMRLQDWIAGVERSGRALANVARDGQLQLGLRGILARHILFHWNRMGFTVRQQAILSRAAREAALG